MNIETTPLEGCVVLTPRVFSDERGYFIESFNQKTFNDAVGREVIFVQDNQSYSTKGVLRGMHLQKGEYAQSKLVRVTDGEVMDVAVDMRKASPTYGKYVSVKLSAENHKQLFVPRGFLHGFVVLSETAIFQYKCDNYFFKGSEGGVNYADPEIGIDWGLDESELIISEKDKELSFLKEVGDLGF